jgi:hypothetical protein
MGRVGPYADPIGKRALAEHVKLLLGSWDTEAVTAAAALHWAMPFDGDELAFFATREQVAGYSISLFGTATWLPQPEDQDWRSFKLGHLRSGLRQDQPGARASKADAFLKQAEAWWSELIGEEPPIFSVRTPPGPKPGTGAKFKSPAAWHAAIREKVLTKETRFDAEDWRIAAWLDVSERYLYERMAEWGPKTLEDLRNGTF